jgi:hypothetical protein
MTRHPSGKPSATSPQVSGNSGEAHDWFSREPVRAKLRTHIRRLLARYDYPPDHERAAVVPVLRQLETFATDWATTTS